MMKQSRAKTKTHWMAVVMTTLGLLFFYHQSAFADPNGMTCDLKEWKPDWTKRFNSCFDKFGENLKSATPNDKSDYCEKDVEPKDYWLSIFMPLAKKESNLDPDAKGKNGGRVPAGLYQMDSQDMKQHQCEGSNPVNPDEAICCAIKIADDQAKKNKSISAGKKGIMADFWQPMRSGMGGDGKGHQTINNTSNLEDIKKTAKQICSMNPSNESGADASRFNGPLFNVMSGDSIFSAIKKQGKVR